MFLRISMVALSGLAMPAMAQAPAPPTCLAAPAPLPPALAGWRDHVTVTAAADPAAIGAATLTIGKGADVALKPTPDIRYPIRPEHPGGSVSSGGLLGFTVAEAGTYRVVIGSAAWIDVLRDGQAIGSTAHSPAPPCTGARKMVDFPLTPGAYLLAIAGNGSPALQVLITRVL